MQVSRLESIRKCLVARKPDLLRKHNRCPDLLASTRGREMKRKKNGKEWRKKGKGSAWEGRNTEMRVGLGEGQGMERRRNGKGKGREVERLVLRNLFLDPHICSVRDFDVSSSDLCYHFLPRACRLSVCLFVCPSVRLSLCDVGGLWSHRLEFFENNFTIS